ncbi:MAG: hypothetical protein ABIP74_01810 [Candidatus Saccharimonas sp.]
MVEMREGPIPLWKPGKKNRKKIKKMLTSNDPLYRAFGEAYRNACYIREFGSPAMETDPEKGLTAVGDLQQLLLLEYRYDTKLDHTKFELGDVINIGMYPGLGETRVERVLDGIRQVLAARESVDEKE